MRLGIGELKLQKKGLLPEMHFQTIESLLRTPRTLFLARQRRQT